MLRYPDFNKRTVALQWSLFERRDFENALDRQTVYASDVLVPEICERVPVIVGRATTSITLLPTRTYEGVVLAGIALTNYSKSDSVPDGSYVVYVSSPAEFEGEYPIDVLHRRLRVGDHLRV